MFGREGRKNGNKKKERNERKQWSHVAYPLIQFFLNKRNYQNALNNIKSKEMSLKVRFAPGFHMKATMQTCKNATTAKWPIYP